MIQIVYARSEPYLTCDGMCWQLAWLSELADIGGATTRASGGALVFNRKRRAGSCSVHAGSAGTQRQPSDPLARVLALVASSVGSDDAYIV